MADHFAAFSFVDRILEHEPGRRARGSYAVPADLAAFPSCLVAEAVVGKLRDDEREGLDAVELLSSGKVDLVVNTPRGRGPRADGAHIRRTATARGIPCLTTVAAALAASAGIVEWVRRKPVARPLQDYHHDGQLRLEM